MFEIEAKIYPVNVDFVENDGLRYYHAWFPLFDNVDGTGETVEEAVASAYEILGIELEYRKEKGIEIPTLEPKEICPSASGRITLRMSKTLHGSLIRMAEDEGVSLNALITTILASHCGMAKATKPERSQSLSSYLVALLESQAEEPDSQGSSYFPNLLSGVLASA